MRVSFSRWFARMLRRWRRDGGDGFDRWSVRLKFRFELLLLLQSFDERLPQAIRMVLLEELSLRGFSAAIAEDLLARVRLVG